MHDLSVKDIPWRTLLLQQFASAVQRCVGTIPVPRSLPHSRREIYLKCSIYILSTAARHREGGPVRDWVSLSHGVSFFLGPSLVTRDSVAMFLGLSWTRWPSRHCFAGPLLQFMEKKQVTRRKSKRLGPLGGPNRPWKRWFVRLCHRALLCQPDFANLWDEDELRRGTWTIDEV